jgi:hypothetical protein
MAGYSGLRAEFEPTPRSSHPASSEARTVTISGFVPAYSGATAPDSHRIPLSQKPAQYAGTDPEVKPYACRIIRALPRARGGRRSRAGVRD